MRMQMRYIFYWRISVHMPYADGCRYYLISIIDLNTNENINQ